jgi:hypothetical protein
VNWRRKSRNSLLGIKMNPFWRWTDRVSDRFAFSPFCETLNLWSATSSYRYTQELIDILCGRFNHFILYTKLKIVGLLTEKLPGGLNLVSVDQCSYATPFPDADRTPPRRALVVWAFNCLAACGYYKIHPSASSLNYFLLLYQEDVSTCMTRIQWYYLCGRHSNTCL